MDSRVNVEEIHQGTKAKSHQRGHGEANNLNEPVVMFLWPEVIVLTRVPPRHRTSAISTEHNAQLSQDNLILMNSRLV